MFTQKLGLLITRYLGLGTQTREDSLINCVILLSFFFSFSLSGAILSQNHYFTNPHVLEFPFLTCTLAHVYVRIHLRAARAGARCGAFASRGQRRDRLAVRSSVRRCASFDSITLLIRLFEKIFATIYNYNNAPSVSSLLSNVMPPTECRHCDGIGATRAPVTPRKEVLTSLS